VRDGGQPPYTTRRPATDKASDTMSTLRTILSAALALCVSLAHAAQPTSYPVKPIRLIIPFAAGGGADVTMRPFAQKLSDALGQSIIFDNRGGGGGVLAGEIASRATPDGYTLLCGAVGVMTVTPNLMKVPFDPVTDFTPITRVADVASILAVRRGFAPGTLKEVVDYAKKNPGKLIWAVSGIGAPGHLAMERFRLDTGINITPVFFKGAGPGAVAVLSGEADIMSANPGVFMPHVKSGRLRLIGTSSAKRLAMLPDLPTYEELGFPGYHYGSWYGLLGPKGTPEAVVARMHRETVKVLQDAELNARYARDGATAVGNTPQEFANFIRSELAATAKLIKAAKIRI
jgi:tripartite-type tricarboxylate transporter receptor subunit TctC